MKHSVVVKQVYRVERSIVMEVDAETPEAALESVDSGEVDVPSFDNPSWKSGWDLQNEETEIAI